MSRVLEWDEPHGWHKFEGGNIAGPEWCRWCDCLEGAHESHEAWLARKVEEFKATLQDACLDLLKERGSAPDGFDYLLKKMAEALPGYVVRLGSMTDEQRARRWCVPLEVYKLSEYVDVGITIVDHDYHAHSSEKAKALWRALKKEKS